MEPRQQLAANLILDVATGVEAVHTAGNPDDKRNHRKSEHQHCGLHRVTSGGTRDSTKDGVDRLFGQPVDPVHRYLEAQQHEPAHQVSRSKAP